MLLIEFKTKVNASVVFCNCRKIALLYNFLQEKFAEMLFFFVSLQRIYL